MKNLTKLALAAAALAAYAAPAHADSNIYAAGIVLSLSQGGSSSLNLYEAIDFNDSRYAPFSPSLGQPTLITNGNVANGTENLGTFDVTTTDSLILDGGEEITYKNSGDDIDGANVSYSVGGTTYSSFGLPDNYDNVNGTYGDQRWYSDSKNLNLLSGLSNGTYTLYFSFDAPFTYTGAGGGSGDHTITNGPGDFTATFTVIPEPSTVMMLLCSSVGGFFYLMRRRRF